MKESGFKDFEKKESPEEVVIKLLKEKGVENEEAREALIKWTIDQEKAVELSSIPEAPILLNVNRARLYFKAGYFESAFENFEDAAEQAYQERKDDLCRQIEKEAEELRESLEAQKNIEEPNVQNDADTMDEDENEK